MHPELIRLIESNEIQIHGDVEYFAELVAAAEREACALTCEGIAANDQSEDSAAQDCAAAIRARGAECIQEAEGADGDFRSVQ